MTDFNQAGKCQLIALFRSHRNETTTEPECLLREDACATARLVVCQTDKDPPCPDPRAGAVTDLVKDQLETEQVDLKHSCPTVFLHAPILREAELLGIEAQ